MSFNLPVHKDTSVNDEEVYNKPSVCVRAVLPLIALWNT